MNYGCGCTMHPLDLVNDPIMLYVGVDGGMKLLQFACFNLQKCGVIGIDVFDEMIESSLRNFLIAEMISSWFRRGVIELPHGDALDLPVDGHSYTPPLNTVCSVSLRKAN